MRARRYLAAALIAAAATVGSPGIAGATTTTDLSSLLQLFTTGSAGLFGACPCGSSGTGGGDTGGGGGNGGGGNGGTMG